MEKCCEEMCTTPTDARQEILVDVAHFREVISAPESFGSPTRPRRVQYADGGVERLNLDGKIYRAMDGKAGTEDSGEWDARRVGVMAASGETPRKSEFPSLPTPATSGPKSESPPPAAMAQQTNALDDPGGATSAATAASAL
ncbi:hypothetical protein CYMTET_5764 [Cymbomonas tetramitiformis]|uniref:Uncharacterized protein n=1 Tax=Cymbomonas tetramitiformis TaxID=36881 RepID=A0AAE0LIR2_9CHLO|nr:hypothetical protein CYMTET_5764 [Cymbomonas tetramitiformis]